MLYVLCILVSLLTRSRVKIKDVPIYSQSTQMRTKMFQNKKIYMIFLLKQCHYARWSEGFGKNNNFDKFECNFVYHQKMSGYAARKMTCACPIVYK